MRLDFETGVKLVKLITESIEAVEAQFNGSLTGEEKKSEVIDVVDAGFDVLAQQLNLHPDMINPIKEKIPEIIDAIVRSANSMKNIFSKSIF